MAKDSNNGLLYIGLGISLISLASFFRKGKQLEKLDVSIDSIRGSREKSNLRLNFNLSVYNPNESPLQFKRFLGNLFYDKTRIADIDVVQTTIFKPRESTKIPVSTAIPIARLTANILDALNKLLDKAKVEMTLNGVLYAENMKVPVNEPFELNLNV